MQLHKIKRYDDPALDRQLEELFRMLAKPSGSGPPTIEPRYLGDEYFDESARVWYKANGLTIADWVEYTTLGHKHTGDDVEYTDTVTAVKRKIIVENATINTEEL